MAPPTNHPPGACPPGCTKHPCSSIAPSGVCPMRSFHPSGPHSHFSCYDDLRSRLTHDKNVRPVASQQLDFMDEAGPLALACLPPLLWGGLSANPIDDMIFETALTANEMMDDITWRPRVDVEFDSKKKEMVILADLPGLQKDDVTIEVDNGALVIKGEKAAKDVKEDDEGKTKSLVTERVSGYFARRFQLPSNYKPDGISATMDNGVLRVTIKVDDSGSTKQQIDVK
ncbi:putative bradyzoite antigen [Neospora caninum Liverpool]|uniref:Bradyzoite antigen, putative n=2 Tax=Neospora caninum TaxID=29176 RepID=F0VGW4_NEOCL|nr:putative bradyzoite antigen [Neospora caninum Liverpool]BAI44436.1 bradyzoite protein BAG1 [Neospora caninum]CBZ52958.1 putative bradyzoite antigen [Neospora caninum Liverpool]CEL66943.1 TPA: bradyzoite antigen, putative [Neospora caninum Liverpool]|eukprot:XP_003882990.1 putative bradyzoite antigen [Neospora caninum Liverpool]